MGSPLEGEHGRNITYSTLLFLSTAFSFSMVALGVSIGWSGSILWSWIGFWCLAFIAVPIRVELQRSGRLLRGLDLPSPGERFLLSILWGVFAAFCAFIGFGTSCVPGTLMTGNYNAGAGFQGPTGEVAVLVCGLSTTLGIAVFSTLLWLSSRV